MIKRSIPIRRSKLTLAVALATLTTSAPSFAQSGMFVEEILVTARKQTESLQDVPISITALDSARIEQLGIENTEDVIKLTPGLTFSRGIGGQDLRPDIRGLTALSGRSNIAILVDGIDQTTDALTGTGAGQLISMGLYDLERVEVVRGPQSALFGRNAFGGAINYITKKPSTDFEGAITIEGAEYETYKGKVSLTGPITDQVLYRVNVAHSEHGGQYSHPITGTKLGEDESDSASLALQFLPTDNLEILTRFDWAEQTTSQSASSVIPYNKCERTVGGVETVIDESCAMNSGYLDTSNGFAFTKDVPVYQGTIGDFEQKNIQLSEEGTDGNTNDLLQFTALINYEMDDYTLTSNTAYTEAEGLDQFDLDYQATVDVFPNESANGFPNLGVPSQANNAFPWVSAANPFNYISDNEFKREVVFQDFRFSFDDGGDVRWLVGVEYYSEDYDQDNYQRANGSTLGRTGGSATFDILADFEVDISDTGGIRPSGQFATITLPNTALPAKEQRETESWGIYASYDWNFAEDWELSVSARYQEETQEIFYQNVNKTLGVPATDSTALAAIQAAGFTGDSFAGFPYTTPFGPPGTCTLTDPDSGTTLPFPGTTSPSGNLCALGTETLYGQPDTTSGEADFEAFNPRVVLTHYLNDNVMLFGSVAQGTKPGGFTFDSGLLPGREVYDQEKLTAYELGWKTGWYNDRIIVNGAYFYNDNTDKQANNQQTETFPPRSYVDNIGAIVSQGVELQLSAILTEGLRMDVAYAYTDTKIKEYTDDRIPPTDLVGKALPRSPKHSALVSFQYDWMMADSTWFARMDTTYKSTSQVDDVGVVHLPSRTLVDFRVGATIDNFEITGYLNNAFGDSTPSSAIEFVNFQQDFQKLSLAFPSQKRTGGIRLKYNF